MQPGEPDVGVDTGGDDDLRTRRERLDRMPDHGHAVGVGDSVEIVEGEAERGSFVHAPAERPQHRGLDPRGPPVDLSDCIVVERHELVEAPHQSRHERSGRVVGRVEGGPDNGT